MESLTTVAFQQLPSADKSIMTVYSVPGQKPKPDDQGKAYTCTRHGVGKAITGGLHDGTFGTILDVSQDYVTNALVNKGKDVGGCWPDEFDRDSILGSLQYNKQILVNRSYFSFGQSII